MVKGFLHNRAIRTTAACLSAALIMGVSGCGAAGPAQETAAGSDPFVKSGEVSTETYKEIKKELLDTEKQVATDALNEKEEKLELLLEEYKQAADSLYTPDMVYGIVEGAGSEAMRSKLYEFCLNLPKGADLHVHNFYGIPRDRLLNLLAETPGILVVTDPQAEEYLRFYGPDSPDIPAGAVPYADALKDGTLTSDTVREAISLACGQAPNNAWTDLNVMFNLFRQLAKDTQVAEKIYEESFRSYCENNVRLLEIRMVLASAEDEENLKALEPLMQAYRAVKKDYPGFRLRLIGAGSKKLTKPKENAIAALDSTIRIKDVLKDDTEPGDRNIIIGLDLVNEEDKSNPLEEYADYFTDDRVKNSGLQLFFHCGESLKLDNDSVLDAYLLGTKRAGHGFNLYRFPDVMELYGKEDIAIEVCPMSNLRLGYVSDLRLHPALSYIRNGLPVTICSDDAVFMEENQLVDDYYAAILNWDLSLADIKLLCRNSLTHGGLSEEETKEMLKDWEKDWAAFVEKNIG